MPEAFNTVRWRASLLVCASVLAIAGPSYAANENATSMIPSDAEGANAVESVIVTGIRGARRTVADSPAPVDVISGEQLLTTGKVGLKEVLNTLIPSFNLPGINGGGTSWTASFGVSDSGETAASAASIATQISSKIYYRK